MVRIQIHAFRVLGRIPRRGLNDTMKTAVDRVDKGRTRNVGSRSESMANHDLFEADFCHPAAGSEQGLIKTGVPGARPRW